MGRKTVVDVARLFFMMLLVVSVISGAVSAQEPTPPSDVGIIQRGLSLGTLVQPGELDAIGTLSGCTATLVADNRVLTAAHCVCPDSSPIGCDTRATFTLDNVFPVDNPSTPFNESTMRQAVSVAGTVRVHPEFGQRGWMREDFAVVDLDQPVSQVAIGVTPIPIESPENTPLPGETLTLVGYGVSGAGCAQPSVGKQKLSLAATVSNFAVIRFNYDGQHCCPGDSGGPVLNSAGHVVGVASWGNFSSESNYRPTSFAYNWIVNAPSPGWSACSWAPVEQAGINSHQPGPDWCQNGSFLVALDLDGDRNISGHDAPVIGQAQCCKLAGAEASPWGSCAWYQVGGLNSHQPWSSWCPNGSFMTQVDLDGQGDVSENDSPVVGQVKCCTLAGGPYNRWGSSYWVGVQTEGINSHQAGQAWCLDGAFLTQIDLDAPAGADGHDSPVVGQAKCSRPSPW